jgi:hypothetical protein
LETGSERERAKRREEGARSWMEKRKLGYIFVSLDSEEKEQRRRGRSQRGAREATFDRIRSKRSGTHERRFDGWK